LAAITSLQGAALEGADLSALSVAQVRALATETISLACPKRPLPA
jgi:hypothetical protein